MPSILGQFPPSEFLQNYYRKEHLFIQGAVQGTVSVLTPSELAGLACEEDVESRLVTRTRDRDARGKRIESPYRLAHGPFTESDFAHLGEEAWTLLVQDVDKFVPEVHALLDLVGFLPRWSIDDIMISYAVRGGTVGPHTDRYDVFLLQVQGTRRWQIARKGDETRLRSDTDLRVLSEFEPEEEFLAQPGDVLYLPPGVAHYGVAENECMTYSFGFRAPTEAALVSYFCDEMSALAGEKQLADENLDLARCGSRLRSGLLRDARKMIQERFDELMKNERSVGRYLTLPKPDLAPKPPDEAPTMRQLRDSLAQGKRLQRHIASRFLYSVEVDEVTLFVDGQDYALGSGKDALGLAFALCDGPPLDTDAVLEDGEGLAAILVELVSRGALVLID